MTAPAGVVIAGASARAAAHSALRAGLTPWCADLFADRDLANVAPVVRVPGESWPGGLAEVLEQAPVSPWTYTGALENHPELIGRISQGRELWGCTPDAVAAVRDPEFFADRVRSSPRVVTAGTPPDDGTRWLVKPRDGTGGRGVQFWDERRAVPPAPGEYAQEYISGETMSAVYLVQGRIAQLVGVTRQLVGCDWLHAGPFQYCGSVGPVDSGLMHARLELGRIGLALGRVGSLAGLINVDWVRRDGLPWPVEINPRYSASVEVLEHGLGLRLLDLHRRACEGRPLELVRPELRGFVAGKAVLYAPADIQFLESGPWCASLELDAGDIRAGRWPHYADIPNPGEMIAAGWPILTVLDVSRDFDDCVARLRRRAGEVYRCLGASGGC